VKTLTELLEDWRALLELSAEVAAQRCGMSGRQQWDLLISGRTRDPRISTLIGIAEGTGFSLETIARAAEAQYRAKAAQPVS
jgi:hypothetical protein